LVGMAAPLFKKNTLEQTQFALGVDGFRHRGIQYRFNDVVETRAVRQRFELKIVGVGSEFTHSISIVFVMRSGEHVQVTEGQTWFYSPKLERVKQIHGIFEIVSEKSFGTRLDKYLRQVESRGYFEYSGWTFHPADRKIVNTESKRAYAIDSVTFSREYGFIAIRDTGAGVIAAMRRSLKKPIGINTLRDADVFFTLLDRFFRLRWN
jgi:hypothetical protein